METTLAPALFVLFVLCGAALGPKLAAWSARIVTGTPTGVDHDAEAAVLATVLSDEQAYHRVSVLTPSDFGLAEHRRIFAAVTEQVSDDAETVSPDGQPLRTIDTDAARATLDDDDDAAVFDRLAARDPLGEDALLAHGQQVLRGSQTLNVPLAVGLSDDSPVPAYLPPATSTLRTVVTSVAAAAVGACAAWLPGQLLAPGAGIAAQLLLAVAVLAAGLASIVVAVVDLDILEIPARLLAGATAVAWAGGAAAAWLAGGYDHTVFAPWWSGLAQAAAVVVGVVVLFEGLNWTFKRFRGHDGQGFGDTLLVPLVFGVPVLLTGNAILAYFTLFGAAGSVLVVWAIRRATTGAGKDVPIPFGPELCAAWLAATVAYALGWITPF